MCWNAQISFNTFAIALFGIIFVSMNGRYANTKQIFWLYATMLCVISMQLLEGFIWTYMDSKRINRILSIIGLCIIYLQPFFACMMIPEFNIRISFVGLYSIFILYNILTTKYDFRTTIGKDGHLVWNWLKPSLITIIIWVFFLICPFVLIHSSIYLIIFLIASILISLYTYKKYGTWGSMWCWMFNIVWIFLIAYYLYKSGSCALVNKSK